MDKTQFLIFETTKYCNLGKLHTQCPNIYPERWQYVNTKHILTNEKIIEITERMYKDFHFKGLIGWHYYNEPTTNQEQNIYLMKEIRKRVPESRFLLWTNGVFLHKCNIDDLNLFEKIYISVYTNLNLDILKDYKGEKNWRNGVLDDRMTAPVDTSDKPCLRMFTEIIFDYHGNVHGCCIDWQGRMGMGNVFINNLDDIVKKWQAVRDSMINKMQPHAPEFCRNCGKRWAGISDLDINIQQLAQQYVNSKA